MTSILIVEDHPIMAAALARLLKERGKFEVITVLSSAEKALEQLPDLPVDVLLVDVSLPGMNGIDLVAAVRERFPDLPCLMLSGHASANYINLSLQAGAKGYVLKEDVLGVLEGIQCVLHGETYVSRQVTGT